MNNKVRNLSFCCLCAAITVVSKEFLAFLPNVELVTFLLMMYALHFTLSSSVMICVIFCFIQIILYGIGMWTLPYFIVWPLLVFTTYGLKMKLQSEHSCAIYSAIFGFLFGFLMSIPYFLISIKTGWIYYLKGLPYDLVHLFSNYIIMMLLYEAIHKLLIYLENKYHI